MASHSSFLWLRPANEMESMLDTANKKGLFVTVYGLTLRSAVPLTDNHIMDALHHTFRKTPSMRTCFRQRGDTLWLCDMNREDIDFEVLDTKDVVPAVESMFPFCFPTTEGPLWCARLFPDGTAGQCSQSELADDFPFCRILLLANHHGIADGTTNMCIMDTFIGVLDNVLSGKPVDDKTQCGRLVAGEETKAILTTRVDKMMEDESHFKQMQKDNKKLKSGKKLIPSAYPMPQDPDFKCQVILRDLDKEATRSFIKKCKAEGVTVNSGLTAVFNVSLVDFVRDGGLKQDCYFIRELHTISMRRYWSGNTSKTLGVHMLPMENIVSTPAEWRNNFWEYARNVHKSLSQGIQQQNSVLYVALSMDESDEDHFAERPSPECDYGSANMGNVDRLIPTEGQQIRLEHLFRVTSCYNDPMYYMWHTLRGSLMYSLTYANDYLTRETAESLVDKTFDNLTTVIKM